jgi:hypothetical protein
MSAFLGSGSLILDVNTSRASFDKKLGQLHDCSQTTMASVCICDDGSKVVDIGSLVSLILRDADAVLPLFSVMEQLCHEQLVHLVRYSVLTAIVRFFLVRSRYFYSHLNSPWDSLRDRVKVHR